MSHTLTKRLLIFLGIPIHPPVATPLFFMYNFASHWRKNFLPHISYVATIPCESLRHKSNTFYITLHYITVTTRVGLAVQVSTMDLRTVDSLS